MNRQSDREREIVNRQSDRERERVRENQADREREG